MNILTIDTTLDRSYIGLLFNGEEIYKTIESNENNYHSAYLIRTLYDIFQDKNINKLEYIAVNTGVGSFTGIRVGLSVAKIISNRLKLKSVSLNTAEILSLAYKNKNIMLDARRGSVFYSNDGKNIELIPYEKALSILENTDKVISDNSLIKRFDNNKKLISFEEEKVDLSIYELELAKEKINNGEFSDYNSIKPTYIQTPPIYSKN